MMEIAAAFIQQIIDIHVFSSPQQWFRWNISNKDYDVRGIRFEEFYAEIEKYLVLK